MTPETPLNAASPATDIDPGIIALDAKVDFAKARAALAAGIDEASIAIWIARTRAEQDTTYPGTHHYSRGGL